MKVSRYVVLSPIAALFFVSKVFAAGGIVIGPIPTPIQSNLTGSAQLSISNTTDSGTLTVSGAPAQAMFNALGAGIIGPQPVGPQPASGGGTGSVGFGSVEIRTGDNYSCTETTTGGPAPICNPHEACPEYVPVRTSTYQCGFNLNLRTGAATN